MARLPEAASEWARRASRGRQSRAMAEGIDLQNQLDLELLALAQFDQPIEDGQAVSAQ
jgi:hypothetical protein